MRKGLFAIGAVLLSAFVASATDFEKYEAFVGYSLVRFNPNSGCHACDFDFPSFNANGGGAQFVYNFNKWKGLGVAFDIGAVTKGDWTHVNINSTAVNFVVGPRYTFRHNVDSRFQPFVQALFGGVYTTSSTHVDILGGTVVNPLIPPITTNPDSPITARLVASRTGFAMLAGGGLDIKVSKHMSIRPIGADYFLTRLPNFLTQNLPNHNDHNANNFSLHGRRELPIWEGLNVRAKRRRTVRKYQASAKGSTLPVNTRKCVKQIFKVVTSLPAIWDLVCQHFLAFG